MSHGDGRNVEILAKNQNNEKNVTETENTCSFKDTTLWTAVNAMESHFTGPINASQL